MSGIGSALLSVCGLHPRPGTLLTRAAVGKAKLNRLLHGPESLEVRHAHATQSNSGEDTQTETGQRGDCRVSSNLFGCALQEILVLLVQTAVC